MLIHTKYEDTGPEDKNYCSPDEVVFYKNQLFYSWVKMFLAKENPEF
jgi:hypothetical protein